MASEAAGVTKPVSKEFTNDKVIKKGFENKTAAEVALDTYIRILKTTEERFCSPFDICFNAEYVDRYMCNKFLVGYENQEPIRLDYRIGIKPMTYHSKASTFGKDLRALCFFYCTYGSHIPTIFQSLEGNAKIVFQFLMDRYSIESEIVDGTTITFKRIAATFPNAICLSFNSNMGKLPITLEKIFLNATFPLCFVCPSLIGCVPKRLLKDLLPFTFLCALELDKTRMLNEKPKRLITDIWFEHIADYKSGLLYCDISRDQFMELLNITATIIERLQAKKPFVMEKIKTILGISPLTDRIIRQIIDGDI